MNKQHSIEKLYNNFLSTKNKELLFDLSVEIKKFVHYLIFKDQSLSQFHSDEIAEDVSFRILSKLLINKNAIHKDRIYNKTFVSYIGGVYKTTLADFFKNKFNFCNELTENIIDTTIDNTDIFTTVENDITNKNKNHQICNILKDKFKNPDCLLCLKFVIYTIIYDDLHFIKYFNPQTMINYKMLKMEVDNIMFETDEHI